MSGLSSVTTTNKLLQVKIKQNDWFKERFGQWFGSELFIKQQCRSKKCTRANNLRKFVPIGQIFTGKRGELKFRLFAGTDSASECAG